MDWDPKTGSLDLGTLRRLYQSGAATPADVVEAVYDRIEARGPDPAWISLVPREQALAMARQLAPGDLDTKPLFGAPFGIKDNFNLAGFETTNACRAFAFTAEQTTPLIQRFIDAGAIPIGKNNMDQFGVGLNGTRTDYGVPACVFDPAYISGGSTSGGAVVVAAGLVSFAIGGDAAGSGRVPAAFNNIVGLKPTPGLVPNTGMRSAAGMVGSHSVLTLTVDDAVTATAVMIGYDPDDPFSKPEAETLELELSPVPTKFRFAIPDQASLFFDGDGEAERLFTEGVARLEALGGIAVETDIRPFLEAARLLYEGPFVAQRTANYRGFLSRHGDGVHPATREILSWGERWSAVDLFEAQYAMRGVTQQARMLFRDVEALLTPTTPTTYTIEALEADNIALNARLGTYTNYVNLLDLPAIAVPGGFRSDGLALGLMLVGPSLSDACIASLGRALHRASGLHLGATPHSIGAIG